MKTRQKDGESAETVLAAHAPGSKSGVGWGRGKTAEPAGQPGSRSGDGRGE